MQPPALDIALVGCGHWGANILRDLRLLGCRVHVADPAIIPDRTAGAHEVVADLDAVGLVAGIVIATPIADHADTVMKALTRDVPIFVEKPLTADPGSAARIAAAGAGRVFMMDKWRYHAGVRQLADLGAQGVLGSVREVRTTRHSPPITQTDVSCAWVLGPHDVAIIETIAGSVIAVRDTSADVVNGALHALRAEVETEHVVASLDISVVADNTVRRIEMVGDHGVAVLEDANSANIHVHSPQHGGDWILPVVGEAPLLAELREFVTFLRGGPAPMVDVASGARTVALIAEMLDLAGVTAAVGSS